jgi:squalene cyclase
MTYTALSIRSLQAFGTAEQKARIERARAWLLKTKPKDTEERVFRLRGLKYSEADAQEIGEATRELAAAQREDGGWGQTDSMASDAYATGAALVALHEAVGMKEVAENYRRGVKFLLQFQREDGTWHVATRSKPIQKYFESGFPYGKDQFISISATGWAVAALALTCDLPKR